METGDEDVMLDSDAGKLSYFMNADEEAFLPQTSLMDRRQIAVQQSSHSSTLIGLSVVLVLLAASVLLAILSLAWRRLTSYSTPLTLTHLSPISAVSDEEQGLLTDVTGSVAATNETTLHDSSRQSQASRPNRLTSLDEFKVCNIDRHRTRRNDIRLSMFMNNKAVSDGNTKEPNDDDDELDQEDLETSTAEQMEWDPQTDIGSPMLPLHNELYPDEKA